MFRFQIKRFFRNPIILSMLVLYPLFMGYICYMNYDAEYPDTLMQSIMMQIPITFLIFLVMSFSFFRGTTERIRETVAGFTGCIIRDYGVGIAIFLLMDILLVGLLGVLGRECILHSVVDQKNEWTIMWFKMLGIYHFLGYLFAILLGCVISLVRKTKKSYIVLVLSYCVFSDFFIQVLGECAKYHPWLKKYFGIFTILTRDYTCALDGYYQFSVEPVNVERILFWIILTIVILSIVITKKNQKKVIAFGIVISIAAFLVYIRPAGYYYVDYVVSSWSDDQFYYHILDEGITGKDNHVSKANFKVKKYSGEITVDRQLDGNLIIEVDKDSLKQYEFTLSHDYEVKEISSGGKQLLFEQKGDHITVHSDNKLEGSKLKILYAGFSNRYFSTSQATYLPGFFCYIPFPGHRLVWFEGEELENGLIDISKEDDMMGLGYKTKFDLKLNFSGNLYTNLKLNSKGHYEGETEGVTLLASDFAKIYQYKDITFVYSGSSWQEQDFKDACQRTLKKIDYENELKGKMIFAPPLTNKWNFYVAQDHLVMDLGDLQDSYGKYREDGEIPYPSSGEEWEDQDDSIE